VTLRQFGPRGDGSEGTIFRLWAPAARTVDLVTSQVTPMRRLPGGWYEIEYPAARAGTRYKFRIDDDVEVPDPASSFQPGDVFGPSEVIDHSYPWQQADWRGRPWHEAAILELHVGTFTPQGTFRSAISKLEAVARTGFTAIELMPVADFFGRWNWGYDGVLPFAPDSVYGRPDDLKALVDAAHAHGLMVFLDVVYNHFGPEGNFIARYAPEFFASGTQTPWGAAIDFGVCEVRAFVIENVLHWLDSYRFDGLRLDAVHAIVKPGDPSILTDISIAAGVLAERTQRRIHLVLENDRNDAILLDPLSDPPRGKYRAQWNDDYHHAWHVLLTGERQNYYQDYAPHPVRHIVRALQSGFAYQGEPSAHRNGAPRGGDSGHLPPTSFVSFLQNHDQIGNRAGGERLDVLAPAAAIEAALAVLLLAPMPPLLFMGEDWGETRPFPFFCDFRGGLADAVRAGRRKEFRQTNENEPDAAWIDPLAEQTFRAAVLDWGVVSEPPYAERYALVRRLLELRKQHIVPHLRRMTQLRTEAAADGPVATAAWRLDGGTLRLKANLSERDVRGEPPRGRAIWNKAHGGVLPPWSVFWTWES
jgi:maltooligosyltrehalose trehalohydrolase